MKFILVVNPDSMWVCEADSPEEACERAIECGMEQVVAIRLPEDEVPKPSFPIEVSMS